MNSPFPLAGVRILDFTWVGAGPFTTKILADFGAEAIKVESRKRPDQLRKAEPLTGNRTIEESGYFANRNVNKKSVSIDLKNPDAREVVLALARRSDVVINSFSPGVMERFDLGYEAIRSVREDIIYVSMPLGGSGGPYRDFLGYGMNIAALTGLLQLGSLPDRWPAGTGTNFPDHIPNPLHAAFAIVTALAARRQTGAGQRVELSQIQSTLAPFPDALLDYAANGRLTVDPTDSDPAGAPHGLFPCAGDDRWCAISVKGDAQFANLCRLIGCEEQAGDARFTTHDGRRKNTQRLDEIVSAWTRTLDAREVMTRLQAAGIAAGVVQTAADLLDEDPHLRARNFWQYLDHPVMGRSVYHGIPAQIDGLPSRYRSPAPTLGQHNHELAELTGLAPDRISQLTAKRVFE